MMETGPFGLVKLDNNKLGLKEREYGWHEYANVVYVDQPVGTGYSYAQTDSYVHDISQAASQFVTFLDNFYQVFPELKNTDVYLSGESFAGQYIPYFGMLWVHIYTKYLINLFTFEIISWCNFKHTWTSIKS